MVQVCKYKLKKVVQYFVTVAVTYLRNTYKMIEFQYYGTKVTRVKKERRGGEENA